jgi:ABC-type nitrate/sulfonate/bicarbonate transport system substrate-binding protein
VKKGAGIGAVADLKGRRIGISTGSTTANIFLQTVLPEAGLKREDVQLVNMKPADQVAALSTGSVEAITSFEPYLSVAEKEGIGTMLLRFGKIDPNPTCLVLSGALVEQSPQTVRVFLKSWQDGVDYWNGHTAEVAEVIHQMYAGAGYSNVTREMADNIVRQVKVEPDITPALAAHIRAEGERLKAANLVKTLPDWSKVLRGDLLPAARA